MALGIFLNSLVLISLRRSSQLRRKLCYFMLQVLSLSDLVAATVTHPIFMLSTIVWSMGSYSKEVEIIWRYSGFLFQGISMLALLIMSVERFTALKFPFAHQTAVTKRRLVSFLGLLLHRYYTLNNENFVPLVMSSYLQLFYFFYSYSST